MLGTGLANLARAQPARWLAVGAAVAIWGLLWRQQVQDDPFLDEATRALKIEAVAVERFLFVANPIALMLLVNAAELRLIHGEFQTVPAALAAAYLPIGWFRRSASHLIMGFLLVAVAMAFPWQAPTIVIGWTALALLALAGEREAARPGGRHAAVTLALAAWVCLFSAALIERSIDASSAVFTDSWALALYIFVAGSAALARWWGTEGKQGLWMSILCGSAVFVGVSLQLYNYFSNVTPLAGDLALSVWWLLYAGALVWLGFRLDRKLVRSTGLTVAALAGVKIVLFDLANLESLYRVGSFFALAIIALTVAYAYNQRARTRVS
jgi:hypothetical protein